MKIIGNKEWLSLPELGIHAIKARIDSGAALSAIHAFDINIITEGGKKFVVFSVNPIHGNKIAIKECRAPFAGWKNIRSSNGLLEQRPSIKATVHLGAASWKIEITLTDRTYMVQNMLLGRDGIPEGVLVNPNIEFVATNKNHDELCHDKSEYEEAVTKPLNIGLLGSNINLYSNKRIMEAGEKRGHNMVFINIASCYIHVKTGVASIHSRELERDILTNIDAVIPRIKPSVTFYGCSLVRQFQTIGKFCLNDVNSIANSRDKLKCLQILASKNIPMPATSFSNSATNTRKLIELVGGAPLLIKLLEGTQGKGVILVETIQSAESVIGAFNSTYTNVLLQEFIGESKGEDIRCFVVDGKVVGSIMRKSMKGDFRANIHLGGEASEVKITPKERKIAVTATKMLGLKVAGVDIIRSKKGPLIIEINSSPGLEGIEGATGRDIASYMIMCIEKHMYGKRHFNIEKNGKPSNGKK